jgi:hypothetical protein
MKKAKRKRTAGYWGKQAKMGDSLGLRFDKALFRNHPEFFGEVHAHVIAPGRMLVVAERITKSRRRENDPVMERFLSFLAADMVTSPQRIKPLDRALADRINALVGHLRAHPHEDLGAEPLV